MERNLFEKFSNLWLYFLRSLLNLLYAITAGIAANNPKAVANSASAIPGATIARLVFLEIAIDWKEFIIPQTVPNNPINGAVEPTVAKKVKPFSNFVICRNFRYKN